VSRKSCGVGISPDEVISLKGHAPDIRPPAASCPRPIAALTPPGRAWAECHWPVWRHKPASITMSNWASAWRSSGAMAFWRTVDQIDLTDRVWFDSAVTLLIPALSERAAPKPIAPPPILGCSAGDFDKRILGKPLWHQPQTAGSAGMLFQRCTVRSSSPDFRHGYILGKCPFTGRH
jgi:hypothetical protein